MIIFVIKLQVMCTMIYEHEAILEPEHNAQAIVIIWLSTRCMWSVCVCAKSTLKNIYEDICIK